MFSTIKKLLAMRCPVCLSTMEPRPLLSELHVDPSGHGVYICRNQHCPGALNEPMVYRRVLQQVEDAKQQAEKGRMATIDDQVSSYGRLNARMNELTTWLRDHYPGHFRGQFRDPVDIAIFVMTNGKDDRSIKGGSTDGKTG